MTYEWIVFFSLFLAFICALCISILIISHTTQSMLYDFKKEFRRFRDGEQYQVKLENNPIVGVKLNLDGSWSEIREKEKT